VSLEFLNFCLWRNNLLFLLLEKCLFVVFCDVVGYVYYVGFMLLMLETKLEYVGNIVVHVFGDRILVLFYFFFFF
jgi:hypothetical protein